LGHTASSDFVLFGPFCRLGTKNEFSMVKLKIISFPENLSLGFIFKISLKFRQFQPQYSYKM